MAATPNKASPITTLNVWRGYQGWYGLKMGPGLNPVKGNAKERAKAAAGIKKTPNTKVEPLNTMGIKITDAKNIIIFIA
jgi:hypothetical protein